MRQAIFALVAMGAVLGAASAARTQEAEEPAPATVATAQSAAKVCPPGIGCVTRQPLPRFVSLKGAQARARRGPGPDHRVDWVYQRPGLPLRVTAEYDNWRRVEDAEGVGGWMHYALLSRNRTALVMTDLAELRAEPDRGAGVVARAETGVVARVLSCRPDWCRISRDGMRGWVEKTSLWGVDPGETFE